MIDIAVIGAAGRMGGAIIRTINVDDSVTLSCALEYAESTALGEDAGVQANIGSLNLPIIASAKGQKFDVMIDFSNPASSLLNLELCLDEKRAIVIGTTGMDEEMMQNMRKAAQTIPVMFSANYSVGINLMAKLLTLTTEVMADDSDIEVIEAHHKHKVDAPSGTALLLGNAIAEAKNTTLKKQGVFSREGFIGEREKGTIGFSTIRGGDIAGEHTVMYIGDSERLEITHRATDRKIFANGAVRAAKWLSDKPAGLYDMNDVLGL